MTKPSGRSGLYVVIAAVAVGGGLIAGWLLWWQPRQARAEARAQIAAWEPRWAEARGCILGDPPLASDPVDALALAELATGSMASSASDCTRVVGKLVRPPGAAAPIDEVERAWQGVEAAIPAVATAYAMRISADADEIDRRVTELGVAISALDGAHDALRAAAGLRPIPRTGAITLQRLPEPTPLVAGDAPITARDVRSIQGGVVLASSSGETQRIVTVTGPGRVAVAAWAAGAVPAMPDGAWMVATVAARELSPEASETALATVALPAAPTVDARTGVRLPDPPVPAIAVAALGRGDERAVVLVPEPMPDRPLPAGTPPFYRALSRDGGRSWTLEPAPAAVAGAVVSHAVEDQLDGRVALYIDPDGDAEELDEARLDLANEMVHLYVLDGARPLELPALLTVPHHSTGNQCHRPDARWSYDDAVGLTRITGDEVALVDPPGTSHTRLVDCTGAAALIEEGTMPVRYHRCVAGRCAEAFRGSTYAYGRPAMLPDGRVVYAAGRGPVIALWTEGVADPTYFELPRALTLHGLVVWDGVPHALVHEPRDPAQALLAVPLTPP